MNIPIIKNIGHSKNQQNEPLFYESGNYTNNNSPYPNHNIYNNNNYNNNNNFYYMNNNNNYNLNNNINSQTNNINNNSFNNNNLIQQNSNNSINIYDSISKNNISINYSGLIKKNAQEKFKIIFLGKDTFFSEIGLNNVGLTCYMSSTLQCLLHVPELNNFFIKIYIIITKKNY
jgi:hypothetical protein